MTYPTMPPMTERQLALIRVLQKKVRCSDELLDTHAEEIFRSKVAELDRRQASLLIVTMQRWESLPADLERLRGQLDLFAVPEGGAS